MVDEMQVRDRVCRKRQNDEHMLIIIPFEDE